MTPGDALRTWKSRRDLLYERAHIIDLFGRKATSMDRLSKRSPVAISARAIAGCALIRNGGRVATAIPARRLNFFFDDRSISNLCS